MTALAAALVPAVLGAITLCCTLDALRWRDHGRAMRSLGLTVTFVTATIVAVWVGLQHRQGLAQSNGFGPEWRCTNDVCVRDQRALQAARAERAAQDGPTSMFPQPLGPIGQPVDLSGR